MALRDTLKRWWIFDVLFDTRTKKLAGINDFANVTTDIVTFDSATSAIIFAGPPPSWLILNKWLRVTSGGGGNTGNVFKVTKVLPDRVLVAPVVVDFSGQATMDGRIWKVINDSTIAQGTTTGSTMYNVHNRDHTLNDGDASEIALTFAEHYHNTAPPPGPDYTAILTQIELDLQALIAFEEEEEPNRIISHNISMPLAGIEQSFTMPANIKSYRITVRDGASVLNLAFNPTESATNYVKVLRGTEFNSGPIKSPTSPRCLVRRWLYTFK